MGQVISIFRKRDREMAKSMDPFEQMMFQANELADRVSADFNGTDIAICMHALAMLAQGLCGTVAQQKGKQAGSDYKRDLMSLVDSYTEEF